MKDLVGKKILLGICGGIAAYKSVELARTLVKMGALVQVVMTRSALDFIGVQTFQAVTGSPVWTDTNDSQFERAMAHIDLSRWADIVVIAPATANFMAKLAHGLADDLLSSICLMFKASIFVCPAMNVNMWQNPATLHNDETLKTRGFILVGPDSGEQACGDTGLGRMREPEYIIHALQWASIYNRLQGQSYVLTAGPTCEPIDPIRFLSNRSSGLMGYYLAEALAFAGASVTLISGPTALNCPPGVARIAVETAQQMHDAVFSCLQSNDVFIGVAAVCDYHRPTPNQQKIKKTAVESLNLVFEPTIDILQAVRKANLVKKVIGFAAETENVEQHARQKLESKADMIIANLVGNNLVFGQQDSDLTVLTQEKIWHLGQNSKLMLSKQLIEIFIEFIK
jgi:phosphopantothenoylcysteine decarboxylase/phosphopantothenate--cysteine ligase